MLIQTLQDNRLSPSEFGLQGLQIIVRMTTVERESDISSALLQNVVLDGWILTWRDARSCRHGQAREGQGGLEFAV